jgi:hypothetical protein
MARISIQTLARQHNLRPEAIWPLVSGATRRLPVYYERGSSQVLVEEVDFEKYVAEHGKPR